MTALSRIAAAYADPSLVVLEGLHPAKHALRFGADLLVAVTDDAAALRQLADRFAPDISNILLRKVILIEREDLQAICQGKLSSPLLSVVKRPTPSISTIVNRTGRPIVFLEDPKNPGNVGAVVRVAAAANIEAVLMSGPLDPWSPMAIRGGAGLQFALTVANASLPLQTPRPIIGVDPEGIPLTDVHLSPDSLLLFGTERNGLSPLARSISSQLVCIPMRQGVSSLNLATAVSAVLFAWKLMLKRTTGTDRWL
jgi:RNA methyltransferase, TrmH family